MVSGPSVYKALLTTVRVVSDCTVLRVVHRRFVLLCRHSTLVNPGFRRDFIGDNL